MKKSYIAFKIEKDGSILLHDHPVFTGDVAYDLQQEQDVQVCGKLNVREFTGVGEMIQAVNDYNREHPESTAVKSGADEMFEVGDVYVLERLTFGPAGVANKAKAKKSVAKSKDK